MSTTYQDLVGKTALVTGATSGIGKATAAALARRGARVLVSGRDVARGEAVVSAIRASSGKPIFRRRTWTIPNLRETWRDAHSILPDTSISS